MTDAFRGYLRNNSRLWLWHMSPWWLFWGPHVGTLSLSRGSEVPGVSVKGTNTDDGHLEVETIWPPFFRRHFQMDFLE